VLQLADGRLGSRLRGYHPVAPRPLRYGPFVHRLQFRPSSPETLHVTRHERPLLVKEGIGREMAGQFGLQFWLPRKLHGSFTCRKSATWDRRLYFPSEGRHAEDFFARNIRRFRQGLNPRSWVPEASMIITRSPKPRFIWHYLFHKTLPCAVWKIYDTRKYIKVTDKCLDIPNLSYVYDI
jgi:hypothetical protein